ncbi:succinate-semialdehyde dehydrogenase/glutarate-semialdehyde dehydrogenase [Angulomicrobium tetraedrale]|uniref:Succinate-semialdehyde dehydrogenase/glutarate-semialdehyde dehydrogenase n=1 Tax=Ancylobacter tetraedralis TaxID=217068 RepID=A0A839Z8N7_9HYPH|nr:NAD-dependent succinate-semialdehyde dehydrogenase [Ancylobacter tetraedralis]MBB3769877.1 succinate-semialdehyde dehydrogenase/glutarate-semialdehyde dehydrogenase [Ancylobacter tetraedralis]
MSTASSSTAASTAPVNYPDVLLFIDGEWREGRGHDGTRAHEPIVNPATEEVIGTLAHASRADLDAALTAAEKGFATWRHVVPHERYKLMRKAAEILRERADTIATLMTLEQGKPLVEARLETNAAADIIDWFAEEARRLYGRVIPARAAGVQQVVHKEPVGVVAAFTPWNFPINQAVRKISAALAAGCSIILKGPEETPASCAALVKAYEDAGLPKGVINLVFGVPAEISAYLIPHPIVKKITFTGSTVVGKQLAALAGLHMKRVTMELGGHAPAVVFEDADLDHAVKMLSGAKFRNAGQVCVSPTRFLVHEDLYARFVDGFTEAVNKVKVGSGLDADVRMGPLANARRVEAMEGFTADALAQGATLRAGGARIGNKGYFFQPTVLTDLPADARILNEEPFGPIVPIQSFTSTEAVIAEANRLPYGLAAYAYTTSAKRADEFARRVESGMVSINHHGLALPETPFGGMKDSGYGSEGGIEAIEAYVNTKFVTELGL